MNEAVSVDLRTQAHAHVDAGQWSEAAKLLRKMERDSGLSPNESVYLGVALTNLNEIDDAIDRFDDQALATSTMRKFVRRRAVVPQIQNRNFPNAEAVLRRLLEVAPDNVTNLASLATVLVREGKHPEATECLLRAYELDPDSVKLRSRIVRAYLRGDDVSGACRFALREREKWAEDGRFAHLSALALMRSDKPDMALGAAEAIHRDKTSDPEAMAVAAEVFLATAQPDRAMEVGRRVVHRRHETARIRHLMARASMKRGDDPSIAMHHLRRCRALEPDHVEATELLADLLMRSGAYQSAEALLESAQRIDPNRIEVQVKRAKALRCLNRHNHAADILSEAINMDGSAGGWQRRAVSAMIRAGQDEAAEAAFETFRRQRDSQLPACLPAGLNVLYDQTGRADLDPETLDWVWKIVQDLPGDRHYRDRHAWERMTKWGHLADRLIGDWLECRPDCHHELAEMFGDLNDIGDRLGTAMQDGTGAIIATAHLGPMHAGLVALRRLGLRYKWLGSSPSISPLAEDDSLIALGELSDTDVTVAFHYALSKGFAVIIPVDGTIDPSAPTIRFEGRDIPYSPLAARAAFRSGEASFFAMPYWKGGKIEFLLRPMPSPQRDEKQLSFEARWCDAYLAHLRNGLALGPENLRLRGGLWRDFI